MELDSPRRFKKLERDMRNEQLQTLSLSRFGKQLRLFPNSKGKWSAFLFYGHWTVLRTRLCFNRCFATPVYSEDELSNMRAVSENEFDCTIGNYTYHIRALHLKPSRIPHCKPKAWKSIRDFASVEFISPDKSCYDSETGCVTLVVDPYRLGKQTTKQCS